MSSWCPHGLALSAWTVLMDPTQSCHVRILPSWGHASLCPQDDRDLPRCSPRRVRMPGERMTGQLLAGLEGESCLCSVCLRFHLCKIVCFKSLSLMQSTHAPKASAEEDKSNLLPSWETIHHPEAQTQYVLLPAHPRGERQPDCGRCHCASETREDSTRNERFRLAQCRHQCPRVPVECSGPGTWARLDPRTAGGPSLC